MSGQIIHVAGKPTEQRANMSTATRLVVVLGLLAVVTAQVRAQDAGVALLNADDLPGLERFLRLHDPGQR